jgi:hypothetical protein
MKLALGIAAALGIVTLARRPAAACGVPDFGQIMVDVAQGLAGERVQVHSPTLIVGGGNSLQGWGPSFTAGYTWGERQKGGLFPGSELTRVLVGYRRSGDANAMSLTYGWYVTGLISAGFDMGAEAQVTGTRALGPTTRLTLGSGGFSVRFTGGVGFGDETRFVGVAEIVVDVLEVSDMI